MSEWGHTHRNVKDSKHVAVGYRDLLNAPSWCTETGSSHKGAGCYSCLCKTFPSCQEETGMHGSGSSLSNITGVNLETQCSTCGKLLNYGSLWVALSLVRSEVHLWLAGPGAKKNLYNFIIFIEATWQNNVSLTEQVQANAFPLTLSVSVT